MSKSFIDIRGAQSGAFLNTPMDDNSVILRRISNRNSAAHFHVSATRTSPAAGCNPRSILSASQRSSWRIWRSSNSTSITKVRNAELFLGGATRMARLVIVLQSTRRPFRAIAIQCISPAHHLLARSADRSVNSNSRLL